MTNKKTNKIMKVSWIVLGFLILLWVVYQLIININIFTGIFILGSYINATLLFFIIQINKRPTKKKGRIIINSGYFDPIHAGHIECFQLSKQLGGRLVAILNNDRQCILKKGKAFMPQSERRRIIESIRFVDEVFDSIDEDRSVCRSIEAIAQKYQGHEIIFAKGGDRFGYEIPEAGICRKYGIRLVDGLGKKIQSSSNLTGLNEIKK